MSADTMRAHPDDLKLRAELDPQAFMAGVALFDEMLLEADRKARPDGFEYEGACICAGDRNGEPLHLYALPMLQRLLAQPAAMPGFAAALGEYIVDLQMGIVPGNGPQYEHLQFDDVWIGGCVSEPEPPTNVVDFAVRAAMAAQGQRLA